ncbi:MAG: rod shape-determining protein MreC [Dehalococcoidia bacterium]|nr:rod shape-determining protein MreC [Dehalococcoidia bacterium]
MLARRTSTWLGSLVLLGLTMLASAALPVAAPLEERALLLVAPVVRTIEDALRPVAAVVLNAGETRALAEGNAALRLENARLSSEVTLLRERIQAETQVQALIEAAGRDSGAQVSASVLLRDPAPGRDVLVVGRGRDAGIRVGQPALGPGATLIGVVSRVEERTARVRLLTDRASTVAALLERSREPVALAGGPEGLRLEFVPVGTPGVEGDVVLSSALGGQLPAGLPIGRVTSVSAQEGDLFQRVRIEPFADYRRLEHVLVLVDFRPGTDPLPEALP